MFCKVFFLQFQLKEARSADQREYSNPAVENLTAELVEVKTLVGELTGKLERATMDNEGKAKKIESMTEDMEKQKRMVEEAFRIARAQK